MNIVSVIRANAQDYLDKPAVIEGAERFTYRQMFLDVDAKKDFLQKTGINRYSRVALIYPDSYEYIILTLALLEMYAVIVPMPVNTTQDECDELIKKIDLHFLLRVEDGTLSLKRFIARDESVEVFNALNPAFIRFSSGTTGTAKGVVLSHQSIIERIDCANEGLMVSEKDNVLWPLQMSFHFVVTILLFLRNSAAIILCGEDFLGSAERALIRERITFIYATPFHYSAMAGSDVFNATMLGSVRCAISTAMSLTSIVQDEFWNKFHCALTQAYGIIEVGLPFINHGHLANSVGKPLSGYKIKVENADETGVGKVMIKGPGMVDAYFFPFRLRSDILKDGWFDTGDLGWMDREGNLYISGREKNVINFAGMKIFPQEVEDVINRYDGVSESLVYPVKHEQYGEIPAARVVGKENHKIDIDGLRKFCYKHLAKYKVPKAVELVERLEKTASGKIKR